MSSQNDEAPRARSAREWGASRARARGPLLATLALALAACEGREATDWSRYAELYQRGAIELDAPGFEASSERWARGVEREAGLRVVSASDEAAPVARVVVGLVDDPPIAALLEGLGVEPVDDASGFRVCGVEHRDPSDALLATFADPERPGLPIVLLAGLDANRLALRFDALRAPWRSRLVTWRGGARGVEVELGDDGRPDLDTLVDPRHDAVGWKGAIEQRAADYDLTFDARVPTARREAYRRTVETAIARARVWLRGPAHARVQIFAYADGERFERASADWSGAWGTGGIARCDPASSRVEVLLVPGLPDDGGGTAALALAYAVLGAPTQAWLADGVAAATANEWWGRSLFAWVGALEAKRMLPPVSEVIGPSAPRDHSPHVVVPARGALVARAMLAGQNVEAAWRGAFPLELHGGYGELPAPSDDALAVRNERKERALARSARGVALAPGPGGYGARRVVETLGRAVRRGADSFSVTVHASRVPPLGTLVPRRSVYGTSSDASLACAIAAGHAEGLVAMLAVGPKATPWGTWLDLGLFSPDDVRADFFECYRSIALHYALLGEALGVETLCLGVGARPTNVSSRRTKIRKNDPQRTIEQRTRSASEWTELFDGIRPAFGGALTTTAFDMNDAERIGHWDALDLVGVLGFEPLAEEGGGEPEVPELRLEVTRVLRRANRLVAEVGKPLVFVQLGFPAREDSWAEPCVPRGAPSDSAQERYYDALATVLGRRSAEELASLGFYLWNDRPDDGGSDRPPSPYSFTGRPAEALVGRVLRRR